ncbi:MAG: hypothetical protein NWS92_02980 [Crocinitomicaceae bacterium]|nr:hypothetical protein [Crocinitomicaceae bacterium]MDP4723648.1 hypothetical protein [Crocinitomicaceae bacterium]MDP4738918.1 hypothetical protein [Crocinitomicaceae bacterium]MDP4798974.1 hypothetical protein [Crocinitomicaceae bacterium]MDP4805745.1 hypothetical protein [Crocinitomicaceae bacterium]
MKYLFLLLPLLLWSCQDQANDAATTEASAQELPTKGKQSLASYADRMVRAKLGIQANEKFELKIYRAQLDADGVEDAVITVNRLDFAMKEAMASPNPAKRAELGFMGNFNYFFFFDGKLDMLSPPITIPSSPLLPLKVSFENISATTYKDILIDFRIRNASYKDFYTVSNHTPRRVFQFKNFDGLGTPMTEAYHFEFGAGSYGTQKNIFVMEGQLEALPTGADKNTFVPKIKPIEKIKYTFFYLESEAKYATKDTQ